MSIFKNHRASPIFHDLQSTFTDDGFIIRQQEFADDFLAQLNDLRELNKNSKAELRHVARIPTVIHHEWLKQGYDCTKEPIDTTLKRLRAQNKQKFDLTR